MIDCTIRNMFTKCLTDGLKNALKGDRDDMAFFTSKEHEAHFMEICTLAGMNSSVVRKEAVNMLKEKGLLK